MTAARPADALATGLPHWAHAIISGTAKKGAAAMALASRIALAAFAAEVVAALAAILGGTTVWTLGGVHPLDIKGATPVIV